MPHPALVVLDQQRDAWNRGDLDGYVAACAPDVVYLNAAGACLGRAALAAALAAAYPDRSAMGALTLTVLRVDPVGHPDVDGSTACVLLRWEVRAAGGGAGGHALVVLRREEGVWWMTHDATVRAAPPGA